MAEPYNTDDHEDGCDAHLSEQISDCTCRPVIRCRSKRAKACYHNKTVIEAQGRYMKDEDWTSDGTYDETSDTVVCDPCYIAIGQPGIAVEHPEARTFGRNIDQGDPRG